MRSVLKRLRTVCLGLGVLLLPNTGFSEDLPTPEDVAIKKKAKVDDFFSPYTPSPYNTDQKKFDIMELNKSLDGKIDAKAQKKADKRDYGKENEGTVGYKLITRGYEDSDGNLDKEQVVTEAKEQANYLLEDTKNVGKAKEEVLYEKSLFGLYKEWGIPQNLIDRVNKRLELLHDELIERGYSEEQATNYVNAVYDRMKQVYQRNQHRKDFGDHIDTMINDIVKHNFTNQYDLKDDIKRLTNDTKKVIDSRENVRSIRQEARKSSSKSS